MKRKYLLIILLPLLMLSFLSVGYSQLTDTSIISMSGLDWSLKVDSNLASSIDSRNTPYMTAKSSTEKELFLELASLEDCKSGVVQFKVGMQGLTAYKQFPLDLELDVKEYEFVNSTHAINGSKVVVYRPENIVNSFALFDDFGRKQAHISATKLVDADSKTVWCDSYLETGLLTIVLPFSWLETAKFPVVLDPVFGYDTVGASELSGLINQSHASKFVLSENGTVTKISAYMRSDAGGQAGAEGIYTDNSGSPNTLVTHEHIASISGSASWVNVTVDQFLSAGTYWLAAGQAMYWHIAYDSGGSHQCDSEDDLFSDGSWTSSSTNDYKLSIFATYTADSDTASPTYSGLSSNATLAGAVVACNVTWADNVGLSTTGGYIFETNNTGVATNSSWSAFSTNPQTVQSIFTLNSTVGNVVQWRCFANDTSNNWNVTSMQSITTTDVEPTPTPTPTPSPSPSPTPEGATATPFPEGAMDDTDWWISILVLLLIIINIFLMMLPFALVRFTFGILSLFLCMLALSYQIPLSPYLQTAGLLISALAMLFSVRARE